MSPKHFEELPSDSDSVVTGPSKTKRKQEMQALQDLGVKLCGFSEQILKKLPLPENLLQAILEAKRLKSHGAMRRQAQYIGKLMRQLDSAPILAAYQKITNQHQQTTLEFHQLENWRDRLIAEGSAAFMEFIQQFPNAQHQQLQQLIDKAINDRTTKRNTGASRRLLQFIKPLIK